MSIPKFWPNIGTTRTSQCLVGKYLFSLLYPVTTNEFSLKDSFDTANRIKVIPLYIFSNIYRKWLPCVSFDMESLFTNVPIKQTVEIILRGLYQDCLVSRNLKNQILKKWHMTQITQS